MASIARDDPSPLPGMHREADPDRIKLICDAEFYVGGEWGVEYVVELCV